MAGDRILKTKIPSYVRVNDKEVTSLFFVALQRYEIAAHDMTYFKTASIKSKKEQSSATYLKFNSMPLGDLNEILDWSISI